MPTRDALVPVSPCWYKFLELKLEGLMAHILQNVMYAVEWIDGHKKQTDRALRIFSSPIHIFVVLVRSF